MDAIDAANELAEKEREATIQRDLAARKGPEFTGKCLNCESPVEKPRRWCDSECRDEWQEVVGE